MLLIRIFPNIFETTHNESRKNTGFGVRGLSKLQEVSVNGTRSHRVIYTKSYDIEHNRKLAAAEQGASSVELVSIDYESSRGMA
jgi:predicted SPOUT superfamily RNA methylase MTH1